MTRRLRILQQSNQGPEGKIANVPCLKKAVVSSWDSIQTPPLRLIVLQHCLENTTELRSGSGFGFGLHQHSEDEVWLWVDLNSQREVVTGASSMGDPLSSAEAYAKKHEHYTWGLVPQKIIHTHSHHRSHSLDTLRENGWINIGILQRHTKKISKQTDKQVIKVHALDIEEA